ncbi:hypothetical protein DM02DRAFT_671272 [Periconia macrospinosa]|uniref:Zn(2)-C6 fungal-type domain-containing protein n=1 Tax=Periconia macrospinosa TaxID=97972 RepID=A0A2V1DTH4_9PLEO|nr:hypothetical protein DM02DRAFT_671272 [Periconia macrospinosa]
MPRRSPGFVSKRPHKKSRGGCLTCKKKKVKCDEGQPACSYCGLRKIQCVYPTEQEKQHSRESTLSQEPWGGDYTELPLISSNSQSLLVPAGHTSSGQLSSIEFELMHHYKTLVWPTLSSRVDESIQYLNRDWAPIKSIKTDYILYSLLSISASHLSLMKSDSQLKTAALQYRHRAISSYTKALNNITSDNYETLLMTSLYMMGMVPPPEQPCKDDAYMEWMNSLFNMMQGLRVLAGLKWIAGIEKLEVYPIFRREVKLLPSPPPLKSVRTDPKFWSVPIRANPPSTYMEMPDTIPSVPHKTSTTSSGRDMSDLPFKPAELMRAGSSPHAPQAWKNPPSWQLPFPAFLPPPLMMILERIIEPPKNEKKMDLHAPVLLPSIHALSPIFLSLYYYRLQSDLYTRITVFPTVLPPPFFDLVARKEPRALIIAGWWFSLTRLSPNTWWLDKTIPRVLQAISNEIMRSNDSGYMAAMEGAFRISREIDIGPRGKTGRERAAKTIFEGWDGVFWEDHSGGEGEAQI